MPPSNTENESCDVIRVGILEVQGAFLEHKVALQRACASGFAKGNVEIKGIRHADDVASDIDGLIIPGGESTAISLFLKRYKMEEPLREWISHKSHVTWGTCAGMILLSKQTEHQKEGGQPSLGVMETVVSRNYFGRQISSFESKIDVDDVVASQFDNKDLFKGVFIRAPAVVNVCNPDVRILGKLSTSDEGCDVVVAVQQGNILATAFHPELTDDVRWHAYFLNMIKTVKEQNRK